MEKRAVKAKPFSFEEQVAYNSLPRRTATINLEGLHASLEMEQLTLEVPAVEFLGPILSESFIEGAKAAGLTEHDLDEAVQAMWNEIEIRQMSRLLAKRMR